MSTTSISTLRRQADAAGYSLKTIRESSRWYHQYGPYMLVDQNNYIVAHGLDIEDIAKELSPG